MRLSRWSLDASLAFPRASSGTRCCKESYSSAPSSLGTHSHLQVPFAVETQQEGGDMCTPIRTLFPTTSQAPPSMGLSEGHVHWGDRNRVVLVA